MADYEREMKQRVMQAQVWAQSQTANVYPGIAVARDVAVLGLIDTANSARSQAATLLDLLDDLEAHLFGLPPRDAASGNASQSAPPLSATMSLTRDGIETAIHRLNAILKRF